MMKPTLLALVGMHHRGTEQVVAAMPDGSPLVIVRDRENQFDRCAIQVWNIDSDGGKHLGFIKKTQNVSLAYRMDAGVRFSAVLRRSEGREWPMVEVCEIPAPPVEAA